MLVRRALLVWLAVLFAGGVGISQYGGEGGYGGIRLHFSGHLVSAGSCQQLAQDTIRCQVPAGSPGSIRLEATVTPAGYSVNITAISLPPWASFTPASGHGAATATCTFQPPQGAAGHSFQLVFRAYTVYNLSVDLTVILDVVSGGPPSGPESSYLTDDQGRFSVPAADFPNTQVAGQLARCPGQPLAKVPITKITLVPKPGRLTIGSLGDVGAVRISTPYGEVTVTRFRLLSSLDISGKVSRTIDLGTVCLPASGAAPAPVSLTEPIPGTTDSAGKFNIPISSGISVSGRLLDCSDGEKKPLPNQEFTLTAKKGEFTYGPGGKVTGFSATEFAISAVGYGKATITAFSRLTMFGLTTYLLGDVCLVKLDLLPWREGRPLTRGDFQGTPPKDVGGRTEAARIEYLLKVEPLKFKPTFDPETKTWTARIDPAMLKVENLMDRSRSWVDPRRKSAWLLAHEQGHFDLNEVYRRILERRLKELSASAPTQKQAAEKLKELIEETWNRVWQKAQEMQKKYDLETAHGQNPAAQAAWGKKIKEWLADPGSAPQP